MLVFNVPGQVDRQTIRQIVEEYVIKMNGKKEEIDTWYL